MPFRKAPLFTWYRFVYSTLRRNIRFQGIGSVILITACASGLDAIEFPRKPGSADFYVDRAGLMDAETRNEINRIGDELWKDEKVARVLKSMTELRSVIDSGAVSIKIPGVVVNMPFLKWPGGKR